MADSTKTVPVDIITNGLTSRIFVAPEANLLDSLIFNRIPIAHSCGGHGICTTCRVLCRSGLEQISPRTEIEAERAEERRFKASERLACQCEIIGPVTIELP